VLIGIPWCFMEIAVGQYSGRGPTAIGDMVPIGKGEESSEVGLYPIFLSSPLFLFCFLCFIFISSQQYAVSTSSCSRFCPFRFIQA
jgi:hypothetical protein